MKYALLLVAVHLLYFDSSVSFAVGSRLCGSRLQYSRCCWRPLVLVPGIPFYDLFSEHLD